MLPVKPILPLRLALMAGVGLTTMGALAYPSLANAGEVAEESAAQDSGQTANQGGAQTDPQDTDFGTDTGGGPGTALDPVEGGQIVVQGARLRGQLNVGQAPLLELGEAEIAAEGVASIADLVTQISNQTGSARGRGGRPIILVNGIRVGSFRELFQYPPEALAKVEVFPEEVAVRFGFAPDQRVINLILKDDYSSREVELEFEGPARGGYFVNEQEFGYLKIADGARINLNLTAQDTSLLTEAERNIIQTPGSVSLIPGDPDPAGFRSLIADSRNLEANLSWAKALIDSGISLSANANYQRNDTRSLDGLNTVSLTEDPSDPDAGVFRTFGQADPLERRTASDTGAIAGSLTAPVNAFRLTSTFDASLSESTTQIDRQFDTQALEAAALAGTLALDGDLPTGAEAGFETAFSRNLSGVNQNTLNGPITDLPGGELLATFDLGYSWDRIESADSRTLQQVQLTRGNINTGANLVIPITSRRTGFADALGSFTLNAQAGLERLSDFGTLGDYNVSLNWTPTDSLDLSATYIYREVAPSLSALGSPQVTNFNVPVFDFVNGETVLADVTSGGNPDLPAETQRDWKFAANWELPFADGVRLTVEYIRNRSDDVTSGFPQITPEIEAAFGDRITRDAAGTLIALDRRAVNFAQTRSERLQFQLSARGSIGAGSRQEGRAEGRGEGRGGPPGAGGPPQGAGGPPDSATGETGRRAGFMAFRTRICADDGLAVMRQVIDTARAGGDVSAIVPGLTAESVQRILSRLGGAESAELTDDQLAQFRERICSVDPAMFGGRPDGAGGEGPGGSGPRGEQFAALRTMVCGEDGLVQMRKLVDAIERGDDLLQMLPGIDPQFLKLILDRQRGPDGTIPDAALEQFRSRICSADGPPGAGQSGGASGSGGPAAGGVAFNPFGGGGGERGWRYFVNLTHTVELANEILIAPGVPQLDQLDGQGTGAFGLPRNTSRLEAGIFGKGLGMRLSGRYTGSTRLDGSGLPGSSDLFFDDLATFDIRVFSNIDELTGSTSPALKNVRVSLRMDNIFDAQRAVRDENGATPINYQPFVIDPVGRFVGVDIRKLF